MGTFAEAIVRASNGQLTEELLDAARDKTLPLWPRLIFAEELARRKDPRVLSLVEDWLDSDQGPVVLMLRVLRRLKAPKYQQYLELYRDHTDPEVRRDVRKMLASYSRKDGISGQKR